MKAEELAQWLNDESQDNPDDPKWQAAAELRRQSSEIERLEARVKELEDFAGDVSRTFSDAVHSGSVESRLRDDARALLEKSNG